jgi:U3 small nucleolar RNA-associated protein 23
MIGETNKHNYVLASQSGALRQKLQNVPGLPIIHFNPREVLVLSPPSVATTRKKNDLEEKKRLEAERGMEGVVDGDNVLGAGAEASRAGGEGGRGGLTSVGSTTVRARKVKTKAPNPLSVRKKKVEKRPREEEEAPTAAVEDEEEDNDDNDNGNDTGGKRRKKRKRGKGKGVVAEARAELASMGMGMEEAGASDAGSDSE